MKQAPQHLSQEAQNWWDRLLIEYEITDEAGFLILQTSLEAFDRMKSAQDVIAKDGQTIKDRFGQLKAHPLCNVERDARGAMLRALKALNLDIMPLHDGPGRPGGK